MLIIAGHLRVEAEDRDAYLTGCVPVIAQARATPGCLDFTLSPDPLEPDRIQVYERWESEEALTHFRDTGPEPEQSARILGAEVRRYEISGVGEA
ncbi:antibiotic biosynthesis monooxygenase [Streptomyces sp. NPDC093252]|uniref:putative quinol monooxygenase n=1 Tax=Streptomyces sp. NPDC093252 TaxID=3154980 RepID=UPI00343F3AC6